MIVVVGAMTAILALTGCSGENPTRSGANTTVSTTEARQSVQDIVDRSTTSLDGDWQVYSGPSVEQCTKGNGDDGAAYSSITALEGPHGDPAQDVAVVKKLWEGAGITTKPYKSGGADPLLGLRGVGGPTTSISFLAGEQRYTITAVSECADGNALQMQGNGE
ncbi:hypothetical protein DEJ33_00985 [Curtobacterium sp. MCPF17_047]|uniref:hypothetical protein n=1 Tax=unclassified Curtobacterium TaxID=257496 RepID=UPI000DA87CE6|nr:MULTISPECIES: hypothetical protein [unclassified Curtobacterium]PZF68972.1 hypothetical protein DEJ33_00985 [Curtobacterium sp. MCPF17_047]WIB11320.1 hypothetical protein DEJ36_09585 [Curtobacterium sp. MCPF17_052]